MRINIVHRLDHLERNAWQIKTEEAVAEGLVAVVVVAAEEDRPRVVAEEDRPLVAAEEDRPRVAAVEVHLEVDHHREEEVHLEAAVVDLVASTLRRPEQTRVP